MQIVSLQLSGFTHYDLNTQLTFRDEHQNLIFDAEGDRKIFLFEAILGIIFGFLNSEKEKFRGDTTRNKTFTGMVTLQLDERTMIIERDFGTDFVACLLSDMKTTRPIYQGKDHVDNGYSRPYLSMLKSIFPIIDKDFFTAVGYNKQLQASDKLSDLLDTLYLLLTPQFKFSVPDNLREQGDALIRKIEALPENYDNLQRFQLIKSGINHVIKIDEQIKQLERDREKLLYVRETIKEKKKITSSTQKLIEEKYPALKDLNPLQLRADVLLWKSLRQIQKKQAAELKGLQQRKQKIQQIIGQDLRAYASLPESFGKDILRYKDLTVKLNRVEKNHKQQLDEIAQLKEKLDGRTKIKYVLLFLVPPIVLFLSLLIFGKNWVLIIPESILVVLIILSIFGHLNSKLRNKIYGIQEESHLKQKKANDYRNDLEAFKKISPVFKNGDYLDSHLERFKKYRRFQAELRRIKKEETRINELLASDPYSRQLPLYTKKYGDAIDIDRPDLEKFLDGYVNLRNALETRESSDAHYPALDEITTLSARYKDAINDLKQLYKKMIKGLNFGTEDNHLNELLDRVDRIIRNLQLQSGLGSR